MAHGDRSIPDPGLWRAGLVLAAVAFVASACASRGQAPPPPPDTDFPVVEGRSGILLGPMVGHTTEESASFWLKVDRPGTLAAIVVDELGASRRGQTVVGADGIGVVPVAGLAPATPYTARFQLDGVPLAVDPPVVFRTFPDDDDPGVLRIALVSCARVPWDSIQPAWRAIDADRPDVVLWLGDNGYLENADSSNPADYSDPARMEHRYAEMRGLASLQPILRHAPHYAIWDDRDYGYSDSDRLFPLREEIARIFERYWANGSYGGDGLDGIWSSFEIGDVEVFLTDGRFWRDPDSLPDSPSKTVLGVAQKAWLKEALEDSDARVKIVAVGTQVLADYHEWESYAMFAYERQELIDWIRHERIEGVMFVSGDRHLSELMRWEPDGLYPLYELTASPVANRFFQTGLELPNPIRVAGYGASPNYGLIEIDTTVPAGRVTFIVKDVEGREVFRHETPIDALGFPGYADPSASGVGSGSP